MKCNSESEFIEFIEIIKLVIIRYFRDGGGPIDMSVVVKDALTLGATYDEDLGRFFPVPVSSEQLTHILNDMIYRAILAKTASPNIKIDYPGGC